MRPLQFLSAGRSRRPFSLGARVSDQASRDSVLEAGIDVHRGNQTETAPLVENLVEPTWSLLSCVVSGSE